VILFSGVVPNLRRKVRESGEPPDTKPNRRCHLPNLTDKDESRTGKTCAVAVPR